MSGGNEAAVDAPTPEESQFEAAKPDASADEDDTAAESMKCANDVSANASAVPAAVPPEKAMANPEAVADEEPVPDELPGVAGPAPVP